MSTPSTSLSGQLLRGTVILAWIITLAALLLGGGYTAFIRPDFWPLMAAALAVLVLFMLALFAKPGHSHATNPLSVVAAGMVVLLPVIYLPLARGQTLGNYAFEKRFVHDSNMDGQTPSQTLARSTTTAEPPATSSISTGAAPANSPPAASSPPASDPASAAAIAMQGGSVQTSVTPATQPTGKARVWDERAVAAATIQEVTISDLLLSPETYLKKHVVVEGMFKSDSRLPKNYYAAYRFIIICCAADAQPSVVFLKTEKPFDFADGSWVRIQGVLIKDKLAGEEMSVLRVDSIEPTPQPERPYMYYTPRTTYETTVTATSPGPSDGGSTGVSTDLK